MKKYVHLIIVTDCGGSDQIRYEIAAQRCFFPYDLRLTLFATQSMNTFHAGFTAASCGLSSIDLFGKLRKGENIGMIVNAAPRLDSNSQKLRGENRKHEGEEIYALHLKNGVWIVGPNAGMNFYFLKNLAAESFVVKDALNSGTPFRSMEVMIPALAQIFNIKTSHNLRIQPKELIVENAEPGIFVADWDSHGNIYLASTMQNDSWIPELGQKKNCQIGKYKPSVPVELRCVNQIFDGNTDEMILTKGSLRLNGKAIYYIVKVGGSAHLSFANPPVGAKVILY